MGATSNFALRMTPELKEAAKLLSGVMLCEPSAKGAGLFSLIAFGSINETIQYLMRSGLRQTLSHVENEILERSEKQELWQELLSFFIQNAAARHALPANFPAGSKARTFIEEVMQEDPDAWADGVDRGWTTDEYAGNQRQVMKLVEAKGAIQKALAFER